MLAGRHAGRDASPAGGSTAATPHRSAAVAPAKKLVVDGVSKRYGPVTALEPIRIEVEKGELLTVLGPSGSGKTTLLQIICGLVSPSAGRLFIDGRDQTDTPVHRRDIGLVFQNYALFPHLTVAENIGFPLRMRRRRARELHQQVAQALEMVQLGHLAQRFPRELSGGQQQRVALARCFVYQPSLILMDEPLGALDKKLREHMQIEVKRLHRDTGATIVYVTHDQEEALALSDRICLMNHARIEQIGAPQDIYARPRTMFAADFIGISNSFSGRLARDAAGMAVLATDDGCFALPDGCGAEAAAGGTARLVIRPEHLQLDPSDGNQVIGQVIETVYAGSETRLLFRLGSGMIATLRLPASRATPPIGATVRAGWSRNSAVLIAQ